jgi:WD40 repeat protein
LESAEHLVSAIERDDVGDALRKLFILLLCLGCVGGETLRQVRFSPDGRYVLAQDDSEITILTVQPFAIQFRIPGQNSFDAQFTPDSRQLVLVSSATRVDPLKIVFSASPPHVERWSIADQARVQSSTLPTLECRTQALSPDGTLLVCIDYKSTVRFIDVESGQTLFEEKNFSRLLHYTPPLECLQPPVIWGELGVAHIVFSPDSHFVLIVPESARGNVIAWNLREKRPIELTGRLKQLKIQMSAFITPDRMVVSHGGTKKSDVKQGVLRARIIEFPSGKLISQI